MLCAAIDDQLRVPSRADSLCRETTSELPTEEGIPATSAALAYEAIPVLLGHRTVDEIPELAESKTELLSHQMRDVVTDFVRAMREARDHMCHTLDRLAEHVVVALV